MNIISRLFSKKDKNSNDLLRIVMPRYLYKDARSLKSANEVLDHLKIQYSDFVDNVGKSDPITKHIKGKIEGIEFMMSLTNEA